MRAQGLWCRFLREFDSYDDFEKHFSRNFASFMKTGRPDEDWKRYDENKENIKVIDI